MIYRSPSDLNYNKSHVTQVQLDALQAQYNIPKAITMRASGPDELPDDALEGMDKILFLIVAFECEARLLLAPL